MDELIRLGNLVDILDWDNDLERWTIRDEDLVKIPSADAVEVVRCKNCARRYDPSECPMTFLIENKFADYTGDDGYCDRGERRKENAVD